MANLTELVLIISCHVTLGSITEQVLVISYHVTLHTALYCSFPRVPLYLSQSVLEFGCH